MNKVVISGATSMIGLSLIKECVRNDTQALAIIRKGSSKRYLLPQSDLIKIIECDIDEFDKVEIPDADCDCFYHFMWAGTTGVARNDEGLQMKNIDYCLDALRLAKKMGCRKFVGAGSQAEYGIKSEILKEDTQADPVTEYGKAKLKACDRCFKLSKDLNIEFNWVRILSVYGENDGENTLISSLIRKIRNKEAVELTACEQIWDYLYCEDAGKAFYLIG